MAEQPDAVIASLATHPGWELLRERMKGMRGDYFENLAKDLYKREQTPDDTATFERDFFRSLHFKRGFFSGVFTLLNNPVFEARDLERLLKERDRADQAQEEPNE